MTRDDFEKGLAEELEHATAEFMRLQKAVIEIISNAPHGLPLTPAQARFIEAAQQVESSYRRYKETMESYRDTLASGGRRRSKCCDSPDPDD